LPKRVSITDTHNVVEFIYVVFTRGTTRFLVPSSGLPSFSKLFLTYLIIFATCATGKEAGDTYTKLAEVNIKLESKHDSATAWVEAAKAYQKCDQKKSVQCLQKAVSLYTDMGRLGMAARQLREIAETLEKEDDSKAESLLFYEQAADLFAADNSTAEANKCLLKVAQFSAEAENYPKAIDIYEQVARAAADNNLLRFSAKGHLLHAALCSLCYAGPAATRDRLERYKDIDVNLDGSRECVLVESLVNATEEGDPEAFTTAVAEFDALTRLDAFKTAILVSHFIFI
jgi:alpha-soluble NSF attachment protein